MEKIWQLLEIDKLDESKQTDLKAKISEIIEVKAKELSQETLEEEKAKLVEDYEQKFEEYKDEITTKFSDFTDTIIENEMTIPDEVLEFAKKGQLYNDLIEQFKVRIGVDQGLLDEETKALLGEARDEIVKLREGSDEQISENLDLRKDNAGLAAQVYLYQKCEGLTDAQRKHVFSVLEGITDQEEIDRKFEIIKESDRFDPVSVSSLENPDDAAEKVREKNKKTSDPKNNETGIPTKMNAKGQNESDEDPKGEGLTEVDNDDDEPIVEDESPWALMKKQYIKVLHEGKVT